MTAGPLYGYKNTYPNLGQDVFVAAGARIIGDVKIGDGSGIWFNAVIRGDVNYIRIGKMTNIQDGAVVHVQTDTHPALLGDYVTVGHNVILHGCKVADNCLIGMGAVLLNGAEIAENCIVGAGALLTENKQFPAGSLIIGAPARVARAVTTEEIAAIRHSAQHYYELAQTYMVQK